MFETIKDRRQEGKTPLEQARLVQLYLLDIFDEICKAHNLKYWLMYGSLLGAKRHGGFIPWDDDIDIGMEISDYRRFKKIAPMLLPTTVLLQIPEESYEARMGYMKLRDRCSFYCEPRMNVTEPSGIFIDIFPFDTDPQFPAAIKDCLCSVLFGANRHMALAMNRLRRSIWLKVFDVVEATGWWLILTSTRVLWKLMSFCKSERICEVGSFQEHVTFKRSWFFPLTMCKFESGSYPVPHDSDAVLTAQYGDWRKLPPEEKRKWHASIIDAMHAPSASWARKWVDPKEKD